MFIPEKSKTYKKTYFVYKAILSLILYSFLLHIDWLYLHKEKKDLEGDKDGAVLARERGGLEPIKTTAKSLGLFQCVTEPCRNLGNKNSTIYLGNSWALEKGLNPCDNPFMRRPWGSAVYRGPNFRVFIIG